MANVIVKRGAEVVYQLPIVSITIPDTWEQRPISAGGSYVQALGLADIPQGSMISSADFQESGVSAGNVDFTLRISGGAVVMTNRPSCGGTLVNDNNWQSLGVAGWCGISATYRGSNYIGIAAAGYSETQAAVLFLVSTDAAGDITDDSQGGPYTPPGTGADAGAGRGAYDFLSDNVRGSALPGSSSLPISNDGHGIHAYSITAAAYGVIARALWGEGDVSDGIAVTGDLWQKWQNYKFNPTAGILSCIRLPWCFMPQPTDPDTNVRIAGTYIGIGGTFGAIPGCKPTDCAPKDFTALDVSIPEQFGSWLDYDGGIDITLVLPFCGRISIDPSSCVNGRVYVVYRCDVATGNLAAYVYTVDRWGNDQLYQQCTGNCAMQVPLIGHDDGQVAMLGTMVGDAVGVAGSVAAGNAAGAVSGLVGAAQSLLMRRESTQIVGGYAGSVSYIASTRPYLLISYAHPTHSYYYERTHGRPSEYAADGSTVGSYTGFTIFNDVKVEGIAGAEDEEKAEIRRLLSEGVIL